MVAGDADSIAHSSSTDTVSCASISRRELGAASGRVSFLSVHGQKTIIIFAKMSITNNHSIAICDQVPLVSKTSMGVPWVSRATEE